MKRREDASRWRGESGGERVEGSGWRGESGGERVRGGRRGREQ